MLKKINKIEEEIIRATIGVENAQRGNLSDVDDIYFKVRGVGEGITKKRLKNHLKTLVKKGYFVDVSDDRNIKRVELGEPKQSKVIRVIEYLGE